MSEESGSRGDPARLLRERQQRAEALRERAERTRAELAAAAATVTSADRTVEVTVGPGGVLRELRFLPAAESVGLGRLAAGVLDAYRQASREAAEAALEAVGSLVGDDSRAVTLLREVLPSTGGDAAAGAGEAR